MLKPQVLIGVVIAVVVLAALATAFAAGCAAKKGDVSFEAIAAHPAPELSATADRNVDIDKNYAYLRNTNYRGFWDDVQRMFYIDNPSRLSPWPIVETSGNPR